MASEMEADDVSPSPLPEDLTTSLLTRYSKAFVEDDEEKIQEAQDEILDLVFDAGWQKFRAIAPLVPKGDSSPRISTKNLHSDLNLETFYFRLVVTKGHAEIVQTPPHPPQFNYFYLNLKDNTLDLPRYSSRDITVTGKLMGSGYIAKVLISGLDMCYKIGTTQSFKAVQREYDCLRQITISKSAASIPTPKLLGLVVDDDGVVLGILEEFIANKGRLSDVVKNEAGVSEERKAKWVKQIRKAVALFHEIGVVWGDGKAENVLVGSESDDCFWLILEAAIRMGLWRGGCEVIRVRDNEHNVLRTTIPAVLPLTSLVDRVKRLRK
ncbi:uncharacterized protein PAC_03691 [Phialocephala subalpina]|uniref:Protein kinase domain-containing protein n=1 Tax=Phialocephala subalpina TaxID=576137 RepID=A0A1L7WM13_9HELO|nr:uncharacterized protein PAC_03691 [Phialocephala subalpina]